MRVRPLVIATLLSFGGCVLPLDERPATNESVFASERVDLELSLTTAESVLIEGEEPSLDVTLTNRSSRAIWTEGWLDFRVEAEIAGVFAVVPPTRRGFTCSLGRVRPLEPAETSHIGGRSFELPEASFADAERVRITAIYTYQTRTATLRFESAPVLLRVERPLRLTALPETGEVLVENVSRAPIALSDGTRVHYAGVELEGAADGAFFGPDVTTPVTLAPGATWRTSALPVDERACDLEAALQQPRRMRVVYLYSPEEGPRRRIQSPWISSRLGGARRGCTGSR
jgi:hypothetical protein